MLLYGTFWDFKIAIVVVAAGQIDAP